jgi:hypothetical protein
LPFDIFIAFLVTRLSNRPDGNQAGKRGSKRPTFKKGRTHFADVRKLRRG